MMKDKNHQPYGVSGKIMPLKNFNINFKISLSWIIFCVKSYVNNNCFIKYIYVLSWYSQWGQGNLVHIESAGTNIKSFHQNIIVIIWMKEVASQLFIRYSE